MFVLEKLPHKKKLKFKSVDNKILIIVQKHDWFMKICARKMKILLINMSKSIAEKLSDPI